MPRGIEEDVLGLEVAISNSLSLMEELEDQDDLSQVEACDVFWETALTAQVAEYFAAGAVIQLREGALGICGYDVTRNSSLQACINIPSP
jgi:hypothetical protein